MFSMSEPVFCKKSSSPACEIILLSFFTLPRIQRFSVVSSCSPNSTAQPASFTALNRRLLLSVSASLKRKKAVGDGAFR